VIVGRLSAAYVAHAVSITGRVELLWGAISMGNTRRRRWHAVQRHSGSGVARWTMPPAAAHCAQRITHRPV